MVSVANERDPVIEDTLTSVTARHRTELTGAELAEGRGERDDRRNHFEDQSMNNGTMFHRIFYELDTKIWKEFNKVQ